MVLLNENRRFILRRRARYTVPLLLILLTMASTSIACGDRGTPYEQARAGPFVDEVSMSATKLAFISDRGDPTHIGTGRVWVVNSVGGHCSNRVSLGPGTAAALSPDGKEIAIAQGQRRATIKVIRIETRRVAEKWKIPAGSGSITHLAWSADGTRLAGDRGNTIVMFVRSGSRARVINPIAAVSHPFWVGERRPRLAVWDGAGAPFFIDAEGKLISVLSNRETRRFELGDDTWCCISPSPNGKWLAWLDTRDHNGRPDEWRSEQWSNEVYLMNRRTGATWRITRTKASELEVAWDSSGDRLAIVRRTEKGQTSIEVLDVKSKSRLSQLSVTNEMLLRRGRLLCR
jgi:dipeptidyl aminopeptidase/acylaminoacyl peptidase